jgi:transposase-like protein
MDRRFSGRCRRFGRVGGSQLFTWRTEWRCGELCRAKRDPLVQPDVSQAIRTATIRPIAAIAPQTRAALSSLSSFFHVRRIVGKTRETAISHVRWTEEHNPRP